MAYHLSFNTLTYSKLACLKNGSKEEKKRKGIHVHVHIIDYINRQGFVQDFFVGGGEREHRPVVLSQMLLRVVKMRLFFIKCINEKTKWL